MKLFAPASIFAVIILTGLAGCTTLPQGVTPVEDFNLSGYLGKWYEIARLDHPFERNLENVTAVYSLNDDGSIKVTNRGYSTKKEAWQNIEGRAVPAGSPRVGHLKVSFFGPVYSSYGIFELDPGGEYAFVSGANQNYLWLLSRRPRVSSVVWKKFEKRASELGFEIGELIRVVHD